MKPKEMRLAPPVFRVRRANEFDLDAWAALRYALWSDCVPEENRAEQQEMLKDPRQAVLVAINSGGDLVGFAELRLRDVAEECYSSPVGYLEGWYVLPECRNQGIGRALVAAGEAWARAQGCTEFASDTWLDNLVSRAAHKALGFEAVGTLVHFKKKL